MESTRRHSLEVRLVDDAEGGEAQVLELASQGLLSSFIKHLRAEPVAIA